MKPTSPMTYGELADIINRCDEDDIIIYLRGIIDLPIDNYQLFKIVTAHDPSEYSHLSIIDDVDGNMELVIS